jgi:hypothetical protein
LFHQYGEMLPHRGVRDLVAFKIQEFEVNDQQRYNFSFFVCIPNWSPTGGQAPGGFEH